MPLTKTRQRQIQQWRSEFNLQNAGGLIVFFKNEIQGWINELRDPQTWAPGCVAVDDQGHCWQSTGGDAYRGAQKWCAV